MWPVSRIGQIPIFRGGDDRVDVRFNSGRTTAISPQPPSGMLSGTASRAQELWSERIATPQAQLRGPLHHIITRVTSRTWNLPRVARLELEVLAVRFEAPMLAECLPVESLLVPRDQAAQWEWQSQPQ
jgi:hypothetical protein